MRIYLCVLSLLSIALISISQPQKIQEEKPKGWFAGDNNSPDVIIGIDTNTFNSGKASAFVKRLPTEVYGYGSIRQIFNAEEYRCKTILVSAFLKAADVEAGIVSVLCQGSGFLVGSNSTVWADAIEQTFPWKQVKLAIEIPPETQLIELVVQVIGQGTIWADDFGIEILESPGDILPRNGTTEQMKKSKVPPRKFPTNEKFLNPGFEDRMTQ